MVERTRSAAAIALLFGLGSGCSAPSVDRSKLVGPHVPSESSSPVRLRSFDPPTRFETKPNAVLEITTDADEVLLHGTTAVVPIHGSELLASSPEEVRLVDTVTNKVRQVIRPTHPLPKLRKVVALPALAVVNSRVTVLSVFLGESPGKGTALGQYLIELVSMDPETGKTDWRTELAVERSSEDYSLGSIEVSVVGVADGVGVVRVVDELKGGDTYAVDQSTPKFAVARCWIRSQGPGGRRGQG